MLPASGDVSDLQVVLERHDNSLLIGSLERRPRQDMEIDICEGIKKRKHIISFPARW